MYNADIQWCNLPEMKYDFKGKPLVTGTLLRTGK